MDPVWQVLKVEMVKRMVCNVKPLPSGPKQTDREIDYRVDGVVGDQTLLPPIHCNMSEFNYLQLHMQVDLECKCI